MSLVNDTDQIGHLSTTSDGLSNQNNTEEQDQVNIEASTSSREDETTINSVAEQTLTNSRVSVGNSDNQQSAHSINNVKPSTSSSLRPRTLSQTLRELSKDRSVVENCPICLLQITDNTRSYAGSCFHTFCYECLLEWSKIKANCPLCKQEFRKIIHDIKSMTDYKEQEIKPPESRSFYTIFTYNNRWGDRPVSLSDFIDRLEARTEHRSDNNYRSDNIRLQLRPQYVWRAGVEAAPIAFRRLVYMYHWRVSETEIETRRESREIPINGAAFILFNTNTSETIVTQINQFRDTRPSFFLRNPAITHRLHQFLFRELKTLAELTNSNDLHHESAILVTHIINLIKLHDINSEEFFNRVLRYIRNEEYTRRFQHEFYVYARSVSPNLTDYDLKCVYYDEDRRRIEMNRYKKYDNPVQIGASNQTFDNRIIITLRDGDANNTENRLRRDNTSNNRATANNSQNNAINLPQQTQNNNNEDSEDDDIIILATTTSTPPPTATTTNETANNRRNSDYIYSDLEDDVNDYFNDRLFADDDDTSTNESIISSLFNSERLLGISESINSTRRSDDENATLSDDQSSYCEEVELTPKSSPAYIVLSSDEDEQANNNGYSNEHEQINNSKLPKANFACKRSFSSSSSSSSSDEDDDENRKKYIKTSIITKYDSESINTADDNDDDDKPTTSKKAMKKSKKHHHHHHNHKSKKSKKHKKKSHKSTKSKKHSTSTSSSPTSST